VNQDFKDLLSLLSGHKADFLVVGAHALAAHGHVRATKDLDVWIRPDSQNAERVLAALAEFGAPLHDLSKEDLSRPGGVFQIGVPPMRIDVLAEIDGLTFAEAWEDRFPTSFAGVPVAVLSLKCLKKYKTAAGRMQDLADLEALSRLEGLEKPDPHRRP
jgi:hypothetical protein